MPNLRPGISRCRLSAFNEAAFKFFRMRFNLILIPASYRPLSEELYTDGIC